MARGGYFGEKVTPTEKVRRVIERYGVVSISNMILSTAMPAAKLHHALQPLLDDGTVTRSIERDHLTLYYLTSNAGKTIGELFPPEEREV